MADERPQQTQAFIDWLDACTRDLIDVHWKRIERVAAALPRGDTLNRQQVQEILFEREGRVIALAAPMTSGPVTIGDL